MDQVEERIDSDSLQSATYEEGGSRATESKIVLDLNDIDKCASFAMEVLARLAYWSVPDKFNDRERMKEAHRSLDGIFNSIRARLKEKSSAYRREYDYIRNQVQGLDPQSDSTEQVGHREPEDGKV